MKKEIKINKEEMKKDIKNLLEQNSRRGAALLTLGCFYDLDCDINRCRSGNYDSEKGTGTCCKYYESKCKMTVESLLDRYAI